MPTGIILKGVGGLYTIKSESGIYYCRARGLFRKHDIRPLPGDNTDFIITDEKKMEGYMTVIHERKNIILRPAVANIDIAIVVISIRNPKPDLFLADKLICIFEGKGIESIMCINKADLADSVKISSIAAQYEKAGYHVVVTDALSGMGIKSLKKHFKNNICIFAGQSGVGKSTLLNFVMGVNIMETGEISKKISRGKHITRHTQFVETEGGYIVDTPGFSSLDSGLLAPKEIRNLYIEFSKYEDDCRFSGCMHIKEPDCAVKNAAKNGIISKDRHERYVKIYTQAREAEAKRRGY